MMFAWKSMQRSGAVLERVRARRQRIAAPRTDAVIAKTYEQLKDELTRLDEGRRRHRDLLRAAVAEGDRQLSAAE